MPESDAKSAVVLELAEEFLERYRRGERPSLKEYADRHPDLAADIRDVFPAMALMENIALRDESLAGSPTGPALTPAAPRLEQFGDYRLIREVGRGGMGIVYEAEQLSLGRHVALKVLPSHALLDPRQLQRFQREAKAVARLHHTNIVPVYGVGEHEGLHYYVMQFIQGLPLDEVLAELRRFRKAKRPTEAYPAKGSPPQPRGGTQDLAAAALAQSLLTGAFQVGAGAAEPAGAAPLPALASPRADGGVAHTAAAPGGPAPRAPASETSVHLPGQSRGSSLSESGRQYWQSVARAGVQVAEALAYASSQGVLHRDIKPSNLLLDLQGTIWVTDFGLAKAASDTEDLTHTGDILGTVRYLAPERFQGQSDIRGDLYSLGLTLYELLTLRPAFAEVDRNKLVKQVMHDEPPRPRKLNPAVPRDLETVVLKAIARDPAHRYQTPAEMAGDLKRFVEDRPVRARQASNAEKFWRWCRRNPVVAGLAACLVLALAGGVVGTSLKWREAESQRRVAVQETRVADAARLEAETARNEAFKARHDSQRQAAELLFDRGVTLAEQGEAAQGLHWMLESLKVGPADAGDLQRLVRTNLAAWGEEVHALRNFLATPDLHVRCLAFSPDGKTFAAGTDDRLQLWDANACKCIGKPLLRKGGFHVVAFSPDGKTLLTGYAQGGAQRWDVTTGALIGEPLPHSGWVRGVAFSSDGKSLLTGSEEGTARLWDAITGKPLQAPFQHDMPVLSVAFSPDGKAVLTGVGSAYLTNGGLDSGRGAVYLWDIASGKQLGPPLIHQWGVPAAAFSPDGQAIVSGNTDGNTAGNALQWDRATGKPKGVPLRHRRGVEHVAFTPDGAVIVTASHYAFGAFLWDVKGQRLGTPLWHQEALESIAISPDGEAILTGGNDSTIRLWQVSRRLSRPIDTSPNSRTEAGARPLAQDRLPNYLLTNVLAYSTDRKTVLVSNGDKIARLWDTHTGQPFGAPLQHPRPVRTVAFSPDGTRVVTSSHDMRSDAATVHLWDAATGRPLAPPIRHTKYVAALAFSPDGRVLAMGDYGKNVRLWDLTTGEPLGEPLPHKGIVFSLTFSPDGQKLAVGTVDSANEVRLWDVATRKPIGGTMPHQNWVVEVAFSKDGKTLLTRSNDRTVRLWNAATSESKSDYLPHPGLYAATLSPDGKTIATGGNDDRVRLWDATTGQPVPGATLVHSSRITALAYIPDGRILGVGCADGSGRLWDVATFRPLGPPLVQRGEIAGVAFLPDGGSFLTTAVDGSTRLWPIPRPLEGDLDRITLQLQVRTGMQMDAGQGIARLDPQTWQARRRQLVALEDTALGAFSSSVSEVAYHEARARDAEQDGATFTALWHLDRLVALRPEDWLLYARRGRAHSAAGHLDRAAAEYRLAAQHVSAEVLLDWYGHRVADCVAAGQDAAALWYQNRMLAAEPKNGRLLGALMLPR
jgi:WD40 repeat protein/serine/threonine protein kinase